MAAASLPEPEPSGAGAGAGAGSGSGKGDDDDDVNVEEDGSFNPWERAPSSLPHCRRGAPAASSRTTANSQSISQVLRPDVDPPPTSPSPAAGVAMSA
jgi:hypothetical protein